MKYQSDYNLFNPPPAMAFKRRSVSNGAKDFISTIRFYWENIHTQDECTLNSVCNEHIGTGNETYTSGLHGYLLKYINHSCCLVLTSIGIFKVEAEDLNFIYTPHKYEHELKTISI
jgi:hypothetical protein